MSDEDALSTKVLVETFELASDAARDKLRDKLLKSKKNGFTKNDFKRAAELAFGGEPPF